jgi:hypothetical protein
MCVHGSRRGETTAGHRRTDRVPTEHFKSKEAYRKWTAYRHIHGIDAPNLKTAVVAGKKHKVKHSKKARKRGGR